MKIKRGSTSVRRLIFIADSSSTTGAGLANLTHASSGLTAYYFAGDLSNEVQISLVSATLGTFTSGGFVAVDNATMPGWYEIGIPNAALDGGNEVCLQFRGAANMVPVNVYIELDSVDYQTAAFGALTSLGTSAPAGWLDTAAFSDSALTAAKFAAGFFTTMAGTIESELLNDASGQAFLAGVAASIQAIIDEGTDIPIATIVALTAAAVRTEMYSNSTKLAAINSKTTNLPAAPAAVGDIPTAAAVRTEMDSNSTKLAAINSKTTNLPAAPAAVGNIPRPRQSGRKWIRTPPSWPR